MLDQLYKELQSQFHFSKTMLDDIQSHFQLKTLKKGEFILKEGQICLHTSYVTKGMVMYYQLHDGEIIPCDFAHEGIWVNYIKSFSTGTPADMFIVALEEVEIYQLSKSDLEQLFAKYPQLLQLQNYYTQKSFVENTQHAFNLAKLTAKERYIALLKDRPEWIQRVPQYYIAAYLGIKPQSLSRIRKAL